MNERTINQFYNQPIFLMGVRFTHLTLLRAADAVKKRVDQRRYSEPLVVFTPNTEQLVQASESTSFLKILNSADVSVPDALGVVTVDWWRAALTGCSWRVRERVPGIDLAENLLATATKQGWKVVLIGGMGDSSLQAAICLKKRFDGLQVWGVEVGTVKEEYKTYMTDKSYMSYIQEINKIKPDLLLVGLGAPKQETWVLAHKSTLTTQVVMVVGGAIDVWSGSSRRAPLWVRNAGLEWLWRLGMEPSRWKRQLRLVKFVWMMVRGNF